jgi:hypothetical protein
MATAAKMQAARTRMRYRHSGALGLSFCPFVQAILILVMVTLFLPGSAKAETCFHACFTGRALPSSVTDQTMRDTMQSCRNSCEDLARHRLISEGFGPLLATCIPERISDDDLRKIRSASAAVMAFANAFTWDVNNVLPDKIIRRVELATQTMSLEDLVVTAAGFVGPGETGTFYIGNVTQGYPAVQLTTRIQAIYACNTH